MFNLIICLQPCFRWCVSFGSSKNGELIFQHVLRHNVLRVVRRWIGGTWSRWSRWCGWSMTSNMIRCVSGLVSPLKKTSQVQISRLETMPDSLQSARIQGGRVTPTSNIAKCLLHCYTCDYQNPKEISNRTCELPISPPCESPPCFRRFFPFFLRSMEPWLLRRSLICADIEIPEIVLVFTSLSSVCVESYSSHKYTYKPSWETIFAYLCMFPLVLWYPAYLNSFLTRVSNQYFLFDVGFAPAAIWISNVTHLNPWGDAKDPVTASLRRCQAGALAVPRVADPLRLCGVQSCKSQSSKSFEPQRPRFAGHWGSCLVLASIYLWFKSWK